MNETTNTMPLNLQFFAEAAAAGETNNTSETTNTEETGKNQETKTDVDIEKVAEEAKAKKEAAILKSYFQQQGMTKEEAEEAFKSWKETKAAEAKAAEEAKKAEEDSKDKAVKDAEAKAEAAIKALNELKIQNTLEKEAISLGVDPARLSIISKMTNAENIKVNENGDIDIDSAKKEIESVLEILPELKIKKTDSVINFGAHQENNNSAQTNTTKNMTYRQKLEAMSNMSK